MTAERSALAFHQQIQRAIGLVKTGQYIDAAVVVGRLEQVSPAHVACVISELKSQHPHNAVVALEIIESVYCPRPLPLLRLIVERGDDGSSFT